jgi:hypothetical protein
MGDTFVWVVLAVGGLVGFGIVAAFRRDAALSGPVLPAWQGLAKRHGLAVEPPGTFVENQSPLVHGAIGDVEVRLDLHATRAGDRRMPVTRLRATAGVPADVALRAEVRSPDLPEDASTMPTLDAEFDAAFVVAVRGDEAARRRAAQLLGDEVRSGLLRVSRPGLRLEVDGASIELSWRGVERDLATLEAALDAVLAVARVRPGGAGYR